MERILVVEDNRTVRTIVADALKSSGYPVDAVEDGQQATSRLLSEKDRPALVLLDLLLPEVDGYELLQLIEGTPSLEGLPVVVMTVLERPPLPEGTMCLRKPVNTEILLSTVQSCLASRATRTS